MVLGNYRAKARLGTYLGSTSLHLTTHADKSRHALWLWLTACSVLLVCIPPTEFGLLYFVLHEAPLFLILVLLGCAWHFASVPVLASAWFFVLIGQLHPFILAAISVLREW